VLRLAAAVSQLGQQRVDQLGGQYQPDMESVCLEMLHYVHAIVIVLSVGVFRLIARV
jgi:hypothetical protein